MSRLTRERLVRSVREAHDVARHPRALLADPRTLRPSRPRLLRELADVDASPADRAFPRAYLPAGYAVREQPRYFLDGSDQTVYQPDVYPLARRIADCVGARRIVDVGCGRADKLMALPGGVERVGIDYGANVAACRARHRAGTWIEHDLDADAPLPLAPIPFPTVLVCADVIEHVRDPHRLLGKLRRALGAGDAAVISTPDRARTRPAGLQAGPPPNLAHAREWALDELAALLKASGFAVGRVGLTRSNDRSPRRATILAVAFGDAATYRRSGLAG